MTFVGALRHLLRGTQFRRLYTVRLTSQFGDGVFQVALASYLLFSPEKQPDAGSIAAALTAVLLPFSVVGPFAGVFLDRWNRRQVLCLANVVRQLPVLAAAAVVARNGSDVVLFVTVIGALSVNRFFLAGLSASLPRVVDRDDLVLANAITPTSGTIAFMAGLGAGSGLRRLPWPGDPDVTLILLGAVIYLAAAGLALRIPLHQLGPDLDTARPAIRAELANVVSGFAAGLRHLRERPTAARALAVIGAHRFCFGLTTVATILLYRNYFNPPEDTDAGLAGLSIAVLGAALGYLAAALLTPIATARMRPQHWMVVLLTAAAGLQAFPAALYTEPAVVVAAFGLGLAAQGIKICVDTLVQTHVDDVYRGRVFSVYDVLFNAVYVAAAAVGAAVIPDDGRSYGLLAVVAAGYLVTAALYASAERTARSLPPVPGGR